MIEYPEKGWLLNGQEILPPSEFKSLNLWLNYMYTIFESPLLAKFICEFHSPGDIEEYVTAAVIKLNELTRLTILEGKVELPEELFKI